MRVLLGLCVCLLFLGQGNLLAQKKGKATDATATQAATKPSTGANSGTFDMYLKMYRQALDYSDLGTAVVAVQSILASSPDKENFKDTLAYLYFNGSQFVQSLLVGNDVLEKNPTNENVLEIVAISQQSLGLLKESLESYEKLYGMSQSVYHKYKIASLEFNLKRFGECQNTINQLMQMPGTDEKITITAGNRQSQNVSIKAALLNMQGVMALELKQNDQAKQSFEAALNLEPEFVLAKANLQAMSQQSENPGK